MSTDNDPTVTPSGTGRFVSHGNWRREYWWSISASPSGC